MALKTINPTYKTENKGGKKGGGLFGAGILGTLGGITGGLAGGAVGGPAGAIAGATGGAAGGVGLGQFLGNAIAPAKAGTESKLQNPSVPTSTFQLAQDSQKLLDGLRIVQNEPSLAQEYAQPLAQAYLQSMVHLKQRG